DKIFTFRGVGLIEASIPKLIALMSDPHKMPDWVYNCVEGELVERNFKETDRAESDSRDPGLFGIWCLNGARLSGKAPGNEALANYFSLPF
ncbi:hypothetical protein, partial [Streptobacillus moniliformis]|uniref:hypothetical protein n=1 Tax=Streptobacillus moniliformis TaxID=34105 RepID=UPI0018C85F58